MHRSWNHFRIGISGGACIIFAFSLLVLPLRWILAALTAAIVHEACHALAVYICGGKLRTLSFGKSGAIMVAEPMTPGKSLLCTLAGPVGSSLMVLAMPWFPRVAFCSAVHCAYNLLPIYPLDGGRALRCIVIKLQSDQQKKVCIWIENICLGLLFVVAAYLAVWMNLGLTPVILATAVFLRAKSANSPCNEGDLGLQ